MFVLFSGCSSPDSNPDPVAKYNLNSEIYKEMVTITITSDKCKAEVEPAFEFLKANIKLS